MPHDFVRDIIPPDERPRQPKRTIEPEMLEDEVMDAHSQPTPPDRSIRNVQMPSKVRPSVAPTIIREHVREQRPPVRRGTDWRRYALFAVAFLILSAVGFMGMLAIGKTTVTIVPRSQSVVFSDRTTITAAPEKAETSTGLTYQTLSQTAEDNALVKSSGVQQVEETASGYVMLFNNFSDAPVKLVKTTRLESTTGLIYRIKDDVSIPGRASGKPGSVSVMAFAENTGEQYNSAAIANMTLPGLKTSKTGMYETVYASAPQGFSGGFKGNRPGVDDATLTATRTTLRSDLETKARAALLAAVPAGSYLAPSLITVSFVSLPTEAAEEGNARVKERVVASGPVFDSKRLAHALAQVSTTDIASMDIHLDDTSSFALSTAEIGLPPIYGTTPLTLYVSGTATFVWDVQVGSLAQSLAGHTTDEFQSIISTYPGIVAGDASILPFWQHSFPKDPADIIIKVGSAKDTTGTR